ncbi:hypothetical protein H6G00_34025 [Leptolyngbya sp. FACHB-541]|uniref:hypothetical protein n=1 Tax=Leptolyngbya sp. FACHB-541 TaxID=2692810 RepID=UPI00168275AF|nr:hypothetical protein [Leptolyngbya sp. FACHB-541]MBD2001552.1 hypothetical protein [Leptolyngbya sp. FACHB-541]
MQRSTHVSLQPAVRAIVRSQCVIDPAQGIVATILKLRSWQQFLTAGVFTDAGKLF